MTLVSIDSTNFISKLAVVHVATIYEVGDVRECLDPRKCNSRYSIGDTEKCDERKFETCFQDRFCVDEGEACERRDQVPQTHKLEIIAKGLRPGHSNESNAEGDDG